MLEELIKKRPIVAIDLGTTKFCTARIAFDQKLTVDFESVPAQGMHRGMLANFEEAVSALQTLLDNAERRWDYDIRRVVTGIAGSHLFSEQITVSEPIHGDIVAPKHLDLLRERAQVASQKSGHECLHLIAQQYKLDDREWITSPIGFSGRQLSAEFLTIYCDETYLRDVIRLMNQCGLQVEEVYAEPFASATVSASSLQRERGCVVADIGGGTTDGIVFQNNKPAALFTVNVGGKLMTKDLAIGLGTDFESAEKIKRRFGLAGEALPVPIPLVDGHQKIVTLAEISPILSARARELGALLATALREFKGALPSGIILTGGGAQVIGLEKYLNELLKVPVEKCLPVLANQGTQVAVTDRLGTPYATVIGLLNLEISRICEKKSKENQFWPSRYLERFVDWIRELS